MKMNKLTWGTIHPEHEAYNEGKDQRTRLYNENGTKF